MHEPLTIETALTWLSTPRKTTMSDEAALALATAERETIRAGGQDLAVWCWGDGPLALLVHCWEGHAGQFHALIQQLLDQGFAVAAPDMPAHGASTGKTSTVVGFGRTVVELADRLGPVELFVGHSVGSAAGLFAFAHGLVAGSSVHLAGPASLDWAISQFIAQVPLPATLNGAFRRRVEEAIGYRIADMEAEVLMKGVVHSGLILHDPDDTAVPYAHGERQQAAWPAARLLPVPGAGHNGILKDPRALAAISAFARETA